MQMCCFRRHGEREAGSCACGKQTLCLWPPPLTPPSETERNLVRKRPDGVGRLYALMGKVEVRGALASLDGGHGLPEKDMPILSAAIASHCPILLTGDIADFGHLIGRTLLDDEERVKRGVYYGRR